MTQSKCHWCLLVYRLQLSSCATPTVCLAISSGFCEFCHYIIASKLFPPNFFRSWDTGSWLVWQARHMIASITQAQQIIDTHTCRRGQKNVDKIRGAKGAWGEEGYNSERASQNHTRKTFHQSVCNRMLSMSWFLWIWRVCVCLRFPLNIWSNASYTCEMGAHNWQKHTAKPNGV